MAPGPSSRSFAMAFCVCGAATSVASLSSVMNRSARMLVKKLMEQQVPDTRDGASCDVRERDETRCDLYLSGPNYQKLCHRCRYSQPKLPGSRPKFKKFR